MDHIATGGRRGAEEKALRSEIAFHGLLGPEPHRTMEGVMQALAAKLGTAFTQVEVEKDCESQ